MIARLVAFLWLAIATVATAANLDHTFVLTLQHSSGARLAIPPAIKGLEVSNVAPAAGGPIYQGETTEVANPLYEGLAAPGSPGSILGVTLTLDSLKPSVAGNGIVHRDIAARNVLITATEGVYEFEIDATQLFSNDGPDDLRGVGPIRWMAPESLRSKAYTPQTGDQRTGTWEIAAFSYFDVSYPVPEPGTAVLALLASATLGSCRARMRRA